MTLTEQKTGTRNAPDLYGTNWLNGGPYTIRRGDGDIVLLDFWSSTCVRCLRDMNVVHRWQEQYAEAGLVIIGVHSPGYDFAHAEQHVDRTLRAHGVTYPVVLDNSGSIRSSYAVRTLPTRMLVDRNGIIRYILHGRKDVLEFERALQFLLRESGFYGELPSLLEAAADLDLMPDRFDTDLPCGYLRGTLGNMEGYAPESLHMFRDPGTALPGRIYLDGPWWSGRDALSVPAERSAPCSLRVLVTGGDLYLVASRGTGEAASLEVLLEDAVLPERMHGRDISQHERAGIRVDEARAYEVAKGLPDKEQEITIRVATGEPEMFQVSIVSGADVRRIFPN